MSALGGSAKAVRAAVRDATAGPRARREAVRRLSRVNAPAAGTAPSRATLRVDVHASERVRAGLADEWTLTAVDPDAVLVEVDARSAVTLEAPFAGQRAAVLAATVPVLVWVTGSARVAADAVERLVAGATVPVHVCVDDEGSLPDWAARLGREVHLLPPAAATRIHSPAAVGATRRREQVVALVGDAGYDRGRLAPVQPQRLDLLGGDDAATEIPGDRPVLGRYRAAAFVADRPATPWQVLEAAAAGTAPIATPAVLDRLPDAVAAETARVEDDTQLALHARAHLWQDELVDRAGLRAGREVRAAHGFAHRAADLEALLERPRPLRGVRGTPFDRSVSAVISTNRAHELGTVADNMARQSLLHSGEVQVVLVLHGLDVDEAEVRARFRDKGIDEMTVVAADASLTLGACLNLGIDASDGAHVAKIDDDNFYGRHYLVDLVDALEYSGAGIAGKWAHYTWLRSTGAVILRFPASEHRFERLVQGGSILMRGDVARDLRFSDLPRAVDTDLLDRAQAAGVRTYSSDRFGYVSIRGTDRHAHTWTVEDASFMNKSSTVVFYGDPREHVDV
ncbi:glycosyltransferase [Janibacter terrae]|uniref:glycosyltransferase n=1 Tax=Janibacter terrae TaxID=103817 RepID=UPI00083830F9|nr:glycosyltransferase [Janibacter terrae]